MKPWIPPLAALHTAVAGCSDDGDKESSADESTPVTDSTDTAPDTTPVWTAYSIETDSTLNGIYASGAGVYVVGSKGRGWVGGNEGTWEPLDVDVDGNDFGDLWGQGSEATLEMVAVAYSGNVARYSGGAWTVDDTGTSNHEGVSATSPAAVYAVSWGGIYQFNGLEWIFEQVPGDERLNDVYVTGTTAIAVGEAGAILVRNNGTWTEMDSGVRTDLNAIAGTASNDVWAVGEEGVALHFDGTSWTPVETGTTHALWAAYAPAASAVYFGGNNGTALLWDGSAMTLLPTGVENNLYAIHGVSSSNVWAVGNRGMALQYIAP